MCEIELKEYLTKTEEGEDVDLWIPLKPKGEIRLKMHWGKTSGRRSVLPTLAESIAKLAEQQADEAKEEKNSSAVLETAGSLMGKYC